MPTPDQQLAALQHEDSQGEVDVNLQEYKQRRDEARRSPYPSVIVEVLSTPPADFGSRLNRRRNTEEEEEQEAAATASRMQEDAAVARARKDDDVDSDVTSEDVKRLEALFAMSAATKESPRNSIDDPFYDALGEVRDDVFETYSPYLLVLLYVVCCVCSPSDFVILHTITMLFSPLLPMSRAWQMHTQFE
jgi:hypothetical protein